VVLLGHSDAHTPAGKVSRDDVAELITAAMFHPAAANATLSVAGAARPTGGIKVGGLLRSSTRPTLCSDEPSPRVYTSNHPEGQSCGHVRSRFECLFSMTLLRDGPVVGPGQGDALPRRGDGGGGKGLHSVPDCLLIVHLYTLAASSSLAWPHVP